MKSNQHNDILTINIKELNKIMTTVAGEIITKPTIRADDFVNMVMYAIGRNHDAYVASMDELHNNYSSLASLINSNVRNGLSGWPELTNDRYLMKGIVTIISSTIDLFSRETLKKFVTQDEWAEAYKEQQALDPRMQAFHRNQQMEQQRGFIPTMNSADESGVPNRFGPYYPWQKQQATQQRPGNPPGGSPYYPPNGRFGMPHGIPNPPGGDYDGNTGFPPNQHPGMFGSLNEYMEYIFSYVKGLEKSVSTLSTAVTLLTDRLDKQPQNPQDTVFPVNKEGPAVVAAETKTTESLTHLDKTVSVQKDGWASVQSQARGHA